ncbi:MAG: 3-oxoacyl-[acyl-carrier protein] reductase [uncultured Chloroflexi bacterium]|uniref:3-oxoacyl-[acyl-carrier protein] reductase n=1 Tax=uncultured Chloroflexota bacterium TaxID=166587 RepID=A0A6J4HBF7_9CHLR|nr:MAG: 3-oxoacyl-[acyl-carrier protein] reductase [uncultured Chloroflexota bacterium]
MGGLDGKVVLVTGGSRGIGKGIARGMAREGASVAIAARPSEVLEQTRGELEALGGPVLAVPADMTDEGQVERLFEAVTERFGRLDVLVNNAGISSGGPLAELTLEAWNRVIATNLTGPFLCTRAAFRIMKAQGGGRIINVSSISAQRVRPNSGPYSASKHGVWGLTQVTALEGRDHNIAASCLYPGNTRIERHVGTTSAEANMSVDELAQAAVWMALLPPHVTMLEATVMPIKQPFIGRG